jgi:hypothetical protein
MFFVSIYFILYSCVSHFTIDAFTTSYWMHVLNPLGMGERILSFHGAVWNAIKELHLLVDEHACDIRHVCSRIIMCMHVQASSTSYDSLCENLLHSKGVERRISPDRKLKLSKRWLCCHVKRVTTWNYKPATKCPSVMGYRLLRLAIVLVS